jgi:tRNA-modifying protein YgfZ
MDDDPTMTTITQQQDAAGAAFVPFGEAVDAPRIVETFGEYEAEYAAFRKGAAIFHAAQRGAIVLRGADRVDFLHRMLTQEVRDLQDGQARRALLLNARGRIMADLRVLALTDQTWLLTDHMDVPTVVTEFDKLLFAEDVLVEDVSGQWQTLALHGPAAAKLIAQVTGGSQVPSLGDGRAARLRWHDGELVVLRCDETGGPGYQVLVNTADAASLHGALADAVGGLVPQVEGNTKRPIVGRGVGWLAYNTARIEAGSALFHIDFGSDCLPHEAALIDAAVSFTKGCYRGQEIVARMQNLGHPKRMLTGFRMGDDAMPIAGGEVEDGEGRVVGAVTSSTVSPLLGGMAVGLAMMKWGWHEPGRAVWIAAEGGRRQATIGPLRAV